MKKILLITTLITLTTSGFSQNSLVTLLKTGPAEPTAAAPLTPDQLAAAAGNAFRAVRPNGDVLLVTANHVATALGLKIVVVEEDIAVLANWPGSPDASKFPRIGNYDEHKPITVRGWSFDENRLVEVTGKPKSLTYSAQKATRKVVSSQGEIALDFRRTRMVELWNISDLRAGKGLRVSPGMSGSPVFQDGKVVGVISSGEIISGRERFYFQILIPKPKPRGLY